MLVCVLAFAYLQEDYDGVKVGAGGHTKIKNTHVSFLLFLHFVPFFSPL